MAQRTRERRKYEDAKGKRLSFPPTKKDIQKTVVAHSKGSNLVLFRLRILYLLRQFKKLTVRMLFYRLVSVYDYPNDRNFYKRLEYSLKVLRKLFPELNLKFDDPTRNVSVPPALPESKIELWVEKSSLEYFLRDVADKYRVPTLAERGFGSTTMFFKAVERARKRGVKKILLVSDHDPSGLLIAEITKKEMPVQVERIVLTDVQIKKYRLRSISVKQTDSRAKKYIEIYGNRAWEVEALDPRILRRIIEQKIRENLTPSELEKIIAEERAAKAVEPIEKELVEKLRREAAELAKKGIAKKGIFERLRRRFRRLFKS